MRDRSSSTIVGLTIQLVLLCHNYITIEFKHDPHEDKKGNQWPRSSFEMLVNQRDGDIGCVGGCGGNDGVGGGG